MKSKFHKGCATHPHGALITPFAHNSRNSRRFKMSQHKVKLVTRVAAAAIIASAASTAMAGATTGDLVVGATLIAGCEVQAGSIAFGNIVALASTADKVADSGSTFRVACSNGASPTISTGSERIMKFGLNSLPFTLGLSALGADTDTFPATATALVMTQNGAMQDVTIHAKVLASDFSALPIGAYTKTVVVDVAY
jgi:hypothetical protein